MARTSGKEGGGWHGSGEGENGRRHRDGCGEGDRRADSGRMKKSMRGKKGWGGESEEKDEGGQR